VVGGFLEDLMYNVVVSKLSLLFAFLREEIFL